MHLFLPSLIKKTPLKLTKKSRKRLKNQPENPPKTNKKAEYFCNTRLFLSTSCLQKAKKHFFSKNRRKIEKNVRIFEKIKQKFKKIKKIFAISKFKNNF